MEVGADFIGMVKTYAKVFYKETVGYITQDWPGVSYLILRRNLMVTGGRTLTAIGYKYNVRTFLYFIITYNSGNTQAGLDYLSK